jgi:hypothetical protein
LGKWRPLYDVTIPKNLAVTLQRELNAKTRGSKGAKEEVQQFFGRGVCHVAVLFLKTLHFWQNSFPSSFPLFPFVKMLLIAALPRCAIASLR